MTAPVGVMIPALQASAKTWVFRYDVVNAAGAVLRTANVMSCSVENNDLAEIKRTCKIVMAPSPLGDNASLVFNQLSERLQPYARLLKADGTYWEWPMGTFYLSSSSTRRVAPAGDRGIPFDGYDGLVVLKEDRVLDRYVVAAGTNYVTAIGTVLTSAGFVTLTGVVATAKTLPAAMEWEPGTSKGVIINDLLAAINYSSLSMSPSGLPTAAPYVDPDTATPVWDYTIDSNSVVVPGIDVALDLFDVPNVFVGIVSQPDRAPLRSVYTNSAGSSTTSTLNRGRSIVRVLTDEVKDAVDQATLDALVIRFAKESAQQFETADFNTGMMPFHDTGDVSRLDYGNGLLKFRETQWSLDLKAGATMKHSMRRTVLS